MTKAYDTLFREIQKGTFPCGATPDIARVLNLSPGSTRSALRRLLEEGHVVKSAIQRRGTLTYLWSDVARSGWKEYKAEDRNTSDVETSAQRDSCGAELKSGRRCSRPRYLGSELCWQHSKRALQTGEERGVRAKFTAVSATEARSPEGRFRDGRDLARKLGRAVEIRVFESLEGVDGIPSGEVLGSTRRNLGQLLGGLEDGVALETLVLTLLEAEDDELGVSVLGDLLREQLFTSGADGSTGGVGGDDEPALRADLRESGPLSDGFFTELPGALERVIEGLPDELS